MDVALVVLKEMRTWKSWVCFAVVIREKLKFVFITSRVRCFFICTTYNNAYEGTHDRFVLPFSLVRAQPIYC